MSASKASRRMRSTTLPMARAPSTRRTAFSPQLAVLSSAMATTMTAITLIDVAVSADLVDGARHHRRERGAEHGGRRHRRRDDQHAPSLGAEVREDAAHQLAVAVGAVVLLGADAVHDERHQPTTSVTSVAAARNGGSSMS